MITELKNAPVGVSTDPARFACGMSKRLSVVLITWNEKAKLQTCLRSLMPALDLDRHEVIVVDNGSRDGTDQMVADEFPQVRYFPLERNIGVGPARNRGISLAQGEMIMILDNDTEVLDPDFPDAIDRAFAEDPKLGLLGFRLENPDGTTQQSTRRFPTVLHPLIARIPLLKDIPVFGRMRARHLMEDVNLDALDEKLTVDYVLGANQIFPKGLAVLLNGYDERIFYGPEDLEFCLRIRDLGLRVKYSNEINIRHEYQRRTRKLSWLLVKFIAAFYWVFWKRRCLFTLK
jgi:GT2 family glycosyltransferase